MKKNFLFFLILINILLGCKKDNKLDYDCYKKEITYSPSNQAEYTLIYYYSNNKLVKLLSGNTIIESFQYDSKGNITLNITGDTKSEYLYNENNQMTKSNTYDKSGKLEISLIYQYENGKLKTIIRQDYINNNLNDTVNYFYLNNGLVKIVSKNLVVLNYYKNNRLDSAFYYDNYGLFFERRCKYNIDTIIWQNDSILPVNGNPWSSTTLTYEYSNDTKLTRSTRLTKSQNGQIIWSDYRSSYNTNGLMLRLDCYDINGLLIYYEKYYYDSENKLFRIDKYDKANILESYMIISGNCI